MQKISALAACGAMLWAMGGVAQAQDMDQPDYGVSDVDVSANIGAVSDYRFRGLSQSDRDPAVQGGVDVDFSSGWYLGGWASSLSNFGGADAEVDLYGGYAGQARGMDYSVGVQSYFYPGANGLNFVEVNGTLAKTLGPASVELKLAWSPDRFDGRDNLYVSTRADIGIPGTPLTGRARVGRENGAFDEKWDWEAGLVYSRDWLSLSASYVDTNYKGVDEAGSLGRAGFVAGVTARF
ncbi:TorF family putative porin [Sphingomonas sp. C3-2]|uniref:TorF family putative porin n=1 Tax=Sphingomonas sp. C3-2 TaxID=3062169 RepID=UPI00294B4DC4|nr:TorF family putative porin [Sphingomonas sp. C3-2]WOK36371.1 TorF family putative porin [Sphingomonas sp. C3-2]